MAHPVHAIIYILKSCLKLFKVLSEVIFVGAVYLFISSFVMFAAAGILLTESAALKSISNISYMWTQHGPALCVKGKECHRRSWI